VDRNQQKGPGAPRSRWVWDRSKQAWVEILEAPAPEVPSREEKGEAPACKQDVEAAPAKGGPAEAELEQVELEYKAAWPRVAAIVIDLVLLYVVAFIITRLVSASAPWVSLPLGFVYFVGFWWWRGQTPGKMVFRARIVRPDGTAIGPGNALLRWVFYLVPFSAPVLFLARRVLVETWQDLLTVFLVAILSLLIVSLSTGRRGIHDVIADTCVVGTRPMEPTGDTAAEEHGERLNRQAG